MYTVKYQEEEFQVTLKNKIKIEKIKAFLLLKRIIRKGRVLIPDNLKMYVLLTMCWILYGAVVYFGGKIYKPTTSYRICDVIWELKNSYFTSVILAIFIGGYNKIENYKEKIVIQHELYVETMSCFEQLFSPILGEEIRYYHIFYNDKCLESTLKFIDGKKDYNLFECDDGIGIIEDIFIQLNRVDEARKNNRIIGMDQEILKLQINNIRKFLRKCNREKKLNIQDMKEISQELFDIVEDIRRPWRWDVENHIKILKLLNQNKENGIENDFYYKMHLNGHNFEKR